MLQVPSETSKPKPPCPDAAAKPTEKHAVTAITGSGRDGDGRDFYAYGCVCGAKWRQIRVDQLDVGEVAEITRDPAILAVTGRKRGNGGKGYLCSVCKQPKKGHVCTADERPTRSTSVNKIVVKVASVPPWYSSRSSNERSCMHTFIWALEQASIPWTKDFMMEFMTRFNLTPVQANEALEVFRAAAPQVEEAHPAPSPRCETASPILAPLAPVPTVG